MNPRLAAMAPLCRDVALPAAVLVWLVAFGSGAVPIVDRYAPVLTADARIIDTRIADTSVAGTLQPMAFAAADAVAASRSITETSATVTPAATQTPAADATTPASPEPAPIVTAAL